MEKFDLEVKKRTKLGKRSNSLRASGIIPAIVYGRGMESMPVEIDEKILGKFLTGASGKNAIINLKMEGSLMPVIMHDVQKDIVSNKLLHVDFHRVSMDQAIKTKVSIVLIGESEGVKSDGGILVHPMREIEIKALPGDIPNHVEIDISKLKIGDAIHVSNLAPIKGVEYLTPVQEIIVTISSPTKEEVVVPVAVEAVPGAVPGAEGAAVPGAVPAAPGAAPAKAAAPGAKAAAPGAKAAAPAAKPAAGGKPEKPQK
ncbi:MAG: 50S ribosomal protein L25 [Candidatus Margulisiibacteriota bacterium]